MTRARAAARASLPACIVAVALAGAAAAQGGSTPVVNCYDAERDIATPMLSSECKGRVVDDAEAERIRQQRLDRVRAGMAARKNTIFPGTRLRSTGTGFYVAMDGSLLTNHHVIRNCQKMTVENPDGRKARGRVVTSSEEIDLALVASDGTPDAIASFSDARIEPGLRADLFGYPTQGIAPEKPFFSAGRVADEQARYRDPRRFLVQADVRSGNSGGPVLDEGGQVLGVVFAQINTVKVRQTTGRELPDIAVAIRNQAVRDFLAPTSVRLATDAGAAPLERDAVRDRSRRFIARIACWQ